MEDKKYYVENSHGVKIDMDIAMSLMDDELREYVAYQLSLSSDQEFFDVYAEEHKKKIRGGMGTCKEVPMLLI